MDNSRYTYAQQAQAASLDAGLRAHMLNVYNYMVMAMLITGVVAYGLFAAATETVGNQLVLNGLGSAIFTSPLSFVIMLAPLALVLLLNFRIRKMSIDSARIMFAVFSAAMGASLSSIFLVYTGESIVQVFFITAAAFGALSLYGYTTKRNLSAMGSFLVMGLFGLLIAMVVNLFLQSSGMSFIISALGVLIFAGLTAYDTQRIKELYFELQGESEATAGKMVILSALTLYLDFINLFLFLLRFLGALRGE